MQTLSIAPGARRRPLAVAALAAAAFLALAAHVPGAPAPTRSHTGYGVSFQYPAYLKLNDTRLPRGPTATIGGQPVTTVPIYLWTTNTFSATVLVISSNATPAHVHQQEIDRIRSNFTGAVMATVTNRIGAADRPGTRIKFSAKGRTSLYEVYSFAQADKTIQLRFTASPADFDRATNDVALIRESFQ